MIRLVILWCSLLVSIAFLFFPHAGKIYFPFSVPNDDGSELFLSYKQWVNDFGDHLAGFMVSVAYYLVEHKYRTSAVVFVCIMFADCVDYILSYGDPWTNSPVTFNTLKVITFGCSIAYDYLKHHGKHPQTDR